MRNTPVSHQLRGHRERRNWTLKDLAKRSGYSEAYLSRMENGFCAPTNPNLLERLADALCLEPIARDALKTAAQESQRILHLPDDTSRIGYSVAHHFIRAIPFLDEDTLTRIDKIVAQALVNRGEEQCP